MNIMIIKIAIRETCINGIFISKILGAFESRREAEEVCLNDYKEEENEPNNEYTRKIKDISYNNFNLELWCEDNYNKWKIIEEEVKLINYQDYDGYLNSLSDEEFRKEMEENDADGKLQEFEDMHYLY